MMHDNIPKCLRATVTLCKHTLCVYVCIAQDYLWISDFHTIFSIKDPGTLTIVRQESETLRFPIAFINFVVATIFLTIHTSSVFWKTSKSFASLAAIFDVIMSFSFLILNSTLAVSLQYHSLLSRNDPLNTQLYSQYACEAMLLMGFVCFLFCRNLAFEGGLQRYMVNQRSFNQMVQQVRVPSMSSGLLLNTREFKDRIKGQLHSYWINVLGFLAWVVEASCLIPLACYLITVYWSTTKIFFILGFIAIICNLVTWFSIWMMLSINHNWIFKVGSTIELLRDDNQAEEANYSCANEDIPQYATSFKGDQNGETYLEDNQWGKSDLYQSFKLAPNYNTSRIPSVPSIPSHFGSDKIISNYQTIPKQANHGSVLNGIDENRQLDNCSGRVSLPYDNSVHPPIVRAPNYGEVSQRSQVDSAYLSYGMKNYSQDSLRSLPFGNRRQTLFELGTENATRGNFDTLSNNERFLTKENILDDNTDISTDFSDPITNSSATDFQTREILKKYQPFAYREENEIYLLQTGV